jgi:hypothetical protein
MMEAVSTSVNFYETTQHNIPEDCKLQFGIRLMHEMITAVLLR